MILKKWRKLTTRDVKAGWRLVSSSLSLVSERGGLVLVVVKAGVKGLRRGEILQVIYNYHVKDKRLVEILLPS